MSVDSFNQDHEREVHPDEATTRAYDETTAPIGSLHGPLNGWPDQHDEADLDFHHICADESCCPESPSIAATLSTTTKEPDMAIIDLADDEPYEYTVAGSPVAVLHTDGTDTIEILPLPGSRTLESSLTRITKDEAAKLVRSLQAAIDEEEA